MQKLQEKWVQSLGWEDTLEWKFLIPSRILAWRIPWREEPGSLSPWGHKESDTTEWLSARSRRRTSLLSKTYCRCISRTSPVVQWLRICCQGREHSFHAWSWKILPAAEQLSPWATITDSVLRCARAYAPQRKSHYNEKPHTYNEKHRNEVTPSLTTTRESPCDSAKAQHSQK